MVLAFEHGHAVSKSKLLRHLFHVEQILPSFPVRAAPSFAHDLLGAASSLLIETAR